MLSIQVEVGTEKRSRGQRAETYKTFMSGLLDVEVTLTVTKLHYDVDKMATVGSVSAAIPSVRPMCLAGGVRSSDSRQQPLLDIDVADNKSSLDASYEPVGQQE